MQKEIRTVTQHHFLAQQARAHFVFPRQIPMAPSLVEALEAAVRNKPHQNRNGQAEATGDATKQTQDDLYQIRKAGAGFFLCQFAQKKIVCARARARMCVCVCVCVCAYVCVCVCVCV